MTCPAPSTCLTLLAALALAAPVRAQVGAPAAKGGGAAEPAARRFELPYEPLEGRARRVIVQVRLNDRITAPMALDTGAPGMVISVRLAEQLGVFTQDQGKLIVLARGIGGEVPALRTILDTVALGQASERFVPVTVTSALSERFEGLIGMDLLGQYSVTIDAGRKVVVLQEQASAGQAPGGHDEAWWRANFAEFRTLRDDWQRFREGIERELADSQVGAGAAFDDLTRWRALATFQVQEAEKLLARLEHYASNQSVPRHWR